jgi:hypothetical protein
VKCEIIPAKIANIENEVQSYHVGSIPASAKPKKEKNITALSPIYSQNDG